MVDRTTVWISHLATIHGSDWPDNIHATVKYRIDQASDDIVGMDRLRSTINMITTKSPGGSSIG